MQHKTFVVISLWILMTALSVTASAQDTETGRAVQQTPEIV